MTLALDNTPDWLPIAYSRELTAAQAERARKGIRSECMEEKWNLDFDQETSILLFSRSWTGSPVFKVVLKEVEDQWSLTEACLAVGSMKAKDDEATPSHF